MPGDDPAGAVPATAAEFLDALHARASDAERVKIRRYVKRDDADNQVIGVRMGVLFALAKAAVDMPLAEVDALFDSPFHEGRLGAVSILDAKARTRLGDDERAALYDLYLRRHDRITSWDMVDRAAPHVVGRYLIGRPADVLYELAGSPDPLRRRTATTATLYFVRYGGDAELAEVFGVASALADDPEPVVARAVGIALKHAGARDEAALRRFLDAEAGRLSPTARREAVAKLGAAALPDLSG